MIEQAKTLQNDHNFLVEEGWWQGKHVIRKTLADTADDHRRKIFKNEITGTEVFYELSKRHPQWHLKVPQNYGEGENWVIREYIDGDILLKIDDSVASATEKLTSLAILLAAIDKEAPPEMQPPEVDSAPFSNIRKRFDTWSRQPLEEGLLSPADYRAANTLIDHATTHLQPRYAHGDLNPMKHVFINDTTLAFIDFEHFSPYKARYYDVAYCYSRLFTRMKDVSVAQNFLQSFLQEAEASDHQPEQLLAIMAQRAIGMHFDALNDRKKGVDYTARAQDLLQRCLTEDISALT